MSFDEFADIRKRLLWRATHRGIKEMDILVGGFATVHVPRMSAAELQQFASVLELADQDLLRWVTGVEQVPAEKRSPLLDAVLAFRPRDLK